MLLAVDFVQGQISRLSVCGSAVAQEGATGSAELMVQQRNVVQSVDVNFILEIFDMFTWVGFPDVECGHGVGGLVRGDLLCVMCDV